MTPSALLLWLAIGIAVALVLVILLALAYFGWMLYAQWYVRRLLHRARLETRDWWSR